MERMPDVSLDFEKRSNFLKRIKPETVLLCEGRKIGGVSSDNPHFPHYLYGIDLATGESIVVSLNDGALPEILEEICTSLPMRVPKPAVLLGKPYQTEDSVVSEDVCCPEQHGEKSERSENNTVTPAAAALVGLAEKLTKHGGKSSQLISREIDIAARKITELLKGERDYEDKRHGIQVFYEVKNFCDIPEGKRVAAYQELVSLEGITDLEERRAAALKASIIGLRKRRNS